MKYESRLFIYLFLLPFASSVMSQSDTTRITKSTQTGNFTSNISTAVQASTNTAYGYQALQSINGGKYNAVFGAIAGYSIYSSNNNAFFGHSAGVNTTGGFNTLMGAWAGDHLTTGTHNTTLGNGAGSKLTTGSYNVMLGATAGDGFYSTGSNSVFVGYRTGYNNTGSRNVFLGYHAGYDEPGSDKLVIDNRNDSATPFIYGDMAFDKLQLNASVKIGKTSAGDPTETLDVDGTMRIRTVNSNNALTQILVKDNSGKVFYRDMNTLPGGGSGSSLWELSNTNIMFNTGQVAIATTTFANGYALSIGGKAIMEEVKVQLETQGWPDYVFASDYNLLPLSDLKTFISENHHLPEIPSAEQVGTDGIELGDMNARLLKKIEELTLYMISLDEEVKRLARENDELKKIIKPSEK